MNPCTTITTPDGQLAMCEMCDEMVSEFYHAKTLAGSLTICRECIPLYPLRELNYADGRPIMMVIKAIQIPKTVLDQVLGDAK